MRRDFRVGIMWSSFTRADALFCQRHSLSGTRAPLSSTVTSKFGST